MANGNNGPDGFHWLNSLGSAADGFSSWTNVPRITPTTAEEKATEAKTLASAKEHLQKKAARDAQRLRKSQALEAHTKALQNTTTKGLDVPFFSGFESILAEPDLPDDDDDDTFDEGRRQVYTREREHMRSELIAGLAITALWIAVCYCIMWACAVRLRVQYAKHAAAASSSS